MRGGATFDATGAYRYHLWREWNASLPPVTFVMLNPSTAGAEQDDPTVRRCLGFARDWGYGRLEVVNLFAYRATSPRELLAAADPVGCGNEAWVARAASLGQIVVAWGNAGMRAPARLRSPLLTRTTTCLGLTRFGQPRHPLYVRGTAQPIPVPRRAVQSSHAQLKGTGSERDASGRL